VYRHHHHPHRADRSSVRPERSIVAVDVLGGFDVVVDGFVTPQRGWSRRSAAALVKILALAPGHHLHREKVMDLLWPDEPPARSAPRLHKAAHFARRATGRDDAVVLRDDVVWLFPDAELIVDVERFETLGRAAVTAGDPELARQALAWYGGELLPGDCYEEWVADRRELLHLRHLDVLRVAGEWRTVTELEPTDEDAHVRLIQAHLDTGRRHAAMRQFERLERVLDRDLGVSPGEAARRARADASAVDPHVDRLLATLAELEDRHRAVVAELAAVGAAPSCSYES
jgi:DNA-binding SARP family transcriptional activator